MCRIWRLCRCEVYDARSNLHLTPTSAAAVSISNGINLKFAMSLKSVKMRISSNIVATKSCSECSLNNKFFCFILQGAERKTRDEERRAAKRKMTATGRKKLDELYHPVVDRSEFYAMSDMNKPPVLFSPAEDIDKVSGTLAIKLFSTSQIICSCRRWSCKVSTDTTPTR